MRKVIAATNITIDGVYDHTEGLSDVEIHEHYADLLDSADIILYGRRTYQLMQYWQTLLKILRVKKMRTTLLLPLTELQKLFFKYS